MMLRGTVTVVPAVRGELHGRLGRNSGSGGVEVEEGDGEEGCEEVDGCEETGGGLGVD